MSVISIGSDDVVDTQAERLKGGTSVLGNLSSHTMNTMINNWSFQSVYK